MRYMVLLVHVATGDTVAVWQVWMPAQGLLT
jgi:hypothetical protein